MLKKLYLVLVAEKRNYYSLLVNLAKMKLTNRFHADLFEEGQISKFTFTLLKILSSSNMPALMSRSASISLLYKIVKYFFPIKWNS